MLFIYDVEHYIHELQFITYTTKCFLPLGAGLCLRDQKFEKFTAIASWHDDIKGIIVLRLRSAQHCCCCSSVWMELQLLFWQKTVLHTIPLWCICYSLVLQDLVDLKHVLTPGNGNHNKKVERPLFHVQDLLHWGWRPPIWPIWVMICRHARSLPLCDRLVLIFRTTCHAWLTKPSLVSREYWLAAVVAMSQSHHALCFSQPRCHQTSA